MSDKQFRRFLGLRFRAWCLLAVMLVFASYVISYYAISRTRMADYEVMRAPGFYYLPWSELGEPEAPGWKTNYYLYLFYSPLNFIDTRLFGGPHVASEPLWGISPRK